MTRYAPILHHLLQSEICKIHWKNVYFSFMAPFRKLYLASSALSHGSEAKFSLFCTASGLILWKNARRIRYFKSESSCNTCFGSPTYKQINTISVLFLQCRPSRFRPHAIAGFRLHASFRRSETVCRAQIDGRRCALPRGPSIESAAHVVDMSRHVRSKPRFRTANLKSADH